MALAIRDGVARRWPDAGSAPGTTSALGMGIAQGYATLGRIGFEGRFDYAAIGSVTNLAARLCAEAGPWQVLVTDRVLAADRGPVAVAELVGDLQPKGFSRPVRVHDVTALDDEAGEAMTDTRPRRRAAAGPLRARRGRALPRSSTTSSSRMPRVWDVMRRDLADESVVVVPSISLERTTAGSGTLMQAMEERASSCSCCSGSRGCGWST